MEESTPAGRKDKGHAAGPKTGDRSRRQPKDPRLEALISDWKRGEKERWRGHGKSGGKRKH